MNASLPHSIRFGDPLRREFLDDLRRRTELPRPLAAEWALTDADLIVAVSGGDDELLLAAGALDGARRWVIRQPLDSFDEGDLVEAFARELRDRGYGADAARAHASRLAARLVTSMAATLSTLARRRPESGSLLRGLAEPLTRARRAAPPALDAPDAEGAATPTAVREPRLPSPARPAAAAAAGPATPATPATPRPRAASAQPASRRAAPAASHLPRRHPGRRFAGRALAGLGLAVTVTAVAAVALDSPVPPADPAASATDGSMSDSSAATAPGAVGDYAVSVRNADTSPARLDPCHTYDYEVQPGALPSDVAVAEAGAGFAALEEALGVAFRFVGSTDDRFPFPVEPDRPPRRPILVSFEHPDESRALVEGADAHLVTPGRPLGGLALAGPTAVRPGFSVLAGGAVVVNETLDAPQRARVLLHELGHVAGLDHATGGSQLMGTPVPETGPVAYREGDRAGLAELRSDECVLTDAERAEIFTE